MGEDKLFMDLAGKPVLARTLTALNACSCVDEIVVVTRLESLEKVAALCREYRVDKVGKVVVGGASRTESALAGLVQIRLNAKYVLIHDGARPLVTEEIVYDAMHSAALYKCAAPAVPVTDTVKETDHDTVVRTLNRSTLAAIQTPQAFVPEIIKAALTRAIAEKKEYTDGGDGRESPPLQGLARKHQDHRTGRYPDGRGDLKNARGVSGCGSDRVTMFTG